MKTIAAVAAAAWLAAGSAGAAARDPGVPRQFQRLHPCPATGLATGACPGWVRDHIVPLCLGGADRIDNLQWQTRAAAREKDRWERARCRG